MPHIQFDDSSVHIQELNKGASETIVLIHGMFSNLSVYYFKIAPLLAAKFHVILYDLKSHGLSSKVATGYRFDSMTADLVDLLDNLEIRRVHLVGYSYGGLIALNAALRQPTRVISLSVIEAPNPADGETRNLIDIYSKEFLEYYIQNFTDNTRVRIGKRQLEKNHRLYEFLFHATSIKKDMEMEADFLVTFPFEQLDKSTLLVYGKQSNCLAAGSFLAGKIKTNHFVSLEGDHNLPIQAPEVLSKVLLEFLLKE